MRARSREVNIFNMSLLDILTGMLGAFLFLMLGLVPYYTKAKKGSNSNADQQPAVDTMFNVITRWDSNAKVDVFLHTDGGWSGPNEKSMPLSSRAKISPNACPSGAGWGMVSVYAAVKDRYLFAVSPQGPFNPEDLRHMRFSMELIEAQIRVDGSGFKSFYPNVWVSSFDASGTRPNTLYGLGWVEITKDTTKGTADDFNLQYNYTYTPVKDGESLPDGAIPLPVGAPMSVTLVPSGSSAPTATSAPDSAPQTTTTDSGTSPSSGTAPPEAPAQPSKWNPLNWFRHSAPPAQKQ